MERTLPLQGVRVGKKIGASSVSRYKLVKSLQLLWFTVNLLTADERAANFVCLENGMREGN